MTNNRSGNDKKYPRAYFVGMWTGIIGMISGSETKKKALDIIMEHHGKKDNEYTDKQVDEVLLLKLKINEMTAKKS